MPIIFYKNLTKMQKESIPKLFDRVIEDPTVCAYSIDEDTGKIIARVPVKLKEYMKLMDSDSLLKEEEEVMTSEFEQVSNKSAVCPHCKVPYNKHEGLTACCEKLQKYGNMDKEYEKFRNEYNDTCLELQKVSLRNQLRFEKLLDKLDLYLDKEIAKDK